jgi:hypothetical protein
VEVNRSGKCEGPGGGDQRGALCTGFTLVIDDLKRLCDHPR